MTWALTQQGVTWVKVMWGTWGHQLDFYCLMTVITVAPISWHLQLQMELFFLCHRRGNLERWSDLPKVTHAKLHLPLLMAHHFFPRLPCTERTFWRLGQEIIDCAPPAGGMQQNTMSLQRWEDYCLLHHKQVTGRSADWKTSLDFLLHFFQ